MGYSPQISDAPMIPLEMLKIILKQIRFMRTEEKIEQLKQEYQALECSLIE